MGLGTLFQSEVRNSVSVGGGCGEARGDMGQSCTVVCRCSKVEHRPVLQCRSLLLYSLCILEALFFLEIESKVLHMIDRFFALSERQGLPK